MSDGGARRARVGWDLIRNARLNKQRSCSQRAARGASRDHPTGARRPLKPAHAGPRQQSPQWHAARAAREAGLAKLAQPAKQPPRRHAARCTLWARQSQRHRLRPREPQPIPCCTQAVFCKVWSLVPSRSQSRIAPRAAPGSRGSELLHPDGPCVRTCARAARQRLPLPDSALVPQVQGGLSAPCISTLPDAGNRWSALGSNKRRGRNLL